MKNLWHPTLLIRKYFLLWYFVVFVLLYRYFIFHVISPWDNIFSDMLGYIERALALAQHQPYQLLDTFYPAGMAYILAPFFLVFKYQTALRVIAIFQCILLVLTNIYLFKIVKDRLKLRYAPYFILFFASYYFPFISYLGYYLAEVTFFFLLISSLYYVIKIIQREATGFDCIIAGLLFGLAMIVKGTLLPAFFLIVILFVLNVQKIGWSKILMFMLIVIVMCCTQIYRNTKILGKLTFISTNGGLSAYLGQAHVWTVFTPNESGGSYHVTNNNFFYDKTLTKQETFNFGVWEQGKFSKMVLNLWQENPIRQLRITFDNVIDLFRIEQQWPARELTHPKVLWDIISQWVFLFLITFPAVFVLISTWFKKRNGTTMSVCFFYILSAVIMAAITKGEQRYLVPFQYVFMIMSAPFWEYIIFSIVKWWVIPSKPLE